MTGDNLKDNLYMRCLEQLKWSKSNDYPIIFLVKYSDVFDQEAGERRFGGREGGYDFEWICKVYVGDLEPR